MDLQILLWINEHWHGVSFVNEFFKYVTYIGEFGAFWVALCVVLLCIKKTRKAGIVLFVALAVDFLIVNLLLKNAVDRTRPYVKADELATYLTSIRLRLPTDSSFPSGHSGAAFAACTALFMCHKKTWPLLIVALLISFSRIYLCVHYPTDVLAGAVIGGAIGVGAYYACKAIGRRFRRD